MTATLMLENETATIEDGEWSASHPTLLDIVTISTDPEWLFGYQPSRDTFIAEKVAEKIGASVTHRDPPPLNVPGRVY